MTNIVNLKQNIEKTEEKPEPTALPTPQKQKPVKKISQTSIKWQANEFDEFKKGKNWYLTSGLVAFLLFLAALLTKNFLLVILVCLLYFIFIAFAAKKPKKIAFAVTPKGIQVDQTLYDFDNLRSFWIDYNPPLTKELSLRSKKNIMPYIKIPLGNQNPTKIRATLLKYMPEKKHKDSVIDNLSKGLGY